MILGYSLLWAYVAEHIQLLLVFSTHTFFLSGCAVETREFRGTPSPSKRVFPHPARQTTAQIACSNPRPSPNPRQSGHRKRGRKGQWDRLGRVRCHRQPHERGLTRALPGPLHAGIYRMSLGYGFVKLMRSFALRTEAVCKLRYRTCLLCAGPCREESAGHLEPNIHAHAYTRDIRNFVSIHPSATIRDLPMYRDAWLEGVEWAENSPCKQEREAGQKLPWAPRLLHQVSFS